MINKTVTIFSLFLFAAAFSCTSGFAQIKDGISANHRSSYNLDQDWAFVKDAANGVDLPKNGFHWEHINLPHTWNAVDVLDDVAGYYRGVGWYKKELAINPEWQDKQVYLCFDGANQETEVFYNGVRIGRHIGGYTGFLLPVSKFLNLKIC